MVIAIIGNKSNMFKKLIILFVIIQIANNFYAQNIQPLVIPTFYYTDNLTITTIDGKDEYRWKDSKKKLSGMIEFDCKIDGGGGIYRGYEGKGLFVNGFKHKKWKIISCDSRVIRIINYNKGLITGNYKIYYEYYKPIKRKDGSISNIKSDTIFYETTFLDGNGIWKDFYKNGNLKILGTYKSGKKDGEWLFYFRGNILYQKLYYENGILLKTEKIEIPHKYGRQVED